MANIGEDQEIIEVVPLEAPVTAPSVPAEPAREKEPVPA